MCGWGHEQAAPGLRAALLSLSMAAGLLVVAGVGRAEDRIGQAWSLNIGCRSDSSPAIGRDGTIYFGAFDGKFWAVGREGTPKWTFQTDMEIKTAPAVGADGTVYFGCRDRKLYAVSPAGRKQWEFKTGGWVDSSPALGGDGTVYFGSWDKNLYALKSDGSKRWQFQTAGAVVSSPAVGVNGQIYFGSHDRKFYALEPDGKVAWVFATGGPILSSPAVDADGALYFTSVDGYFYALNSDGSLRWRLRTGGITESSPIVAAGGRLYVGVNRALWALSPDGKRVGERGLEDLIDATPAALADDTVYVVSRFGWLTAFDAQQKYQWSFFLSATYVNGSPAVSPAGIVYAAGNVRTFYALQTNVPPARTAWPKFHHDARNTGNANTEMP
jgi:outer membrane protein assembly factor BamB